MPQMRPVAHVSLVLGVVRRWAGATVLARRSTPHPAHVCSPGRGVAAWVLALRAGDQARSKVGQRLEERGLREGLPAGCTRASLQDDRCGHRLEALCAAHLTTV